MLLLGEKQVGWEKTNGTCLQGYIDATYDELVKAFGLPSDEQQDKVDLEWVIYHPDTMTVATIYNWKDGPAYGGYSMHWLKTEKKRWNVGGHNPRALELVQAVLEASKRPQLGKAREMDLDGPIIDI